MRTLTVQGSVSTALPPVKAVPTDRIHQVEIGAVKQP